jgi:hypothetical protein
MNCPVALISYGRKCDLNCWPVLAFRVHQILGSCLFNLVSRRNCWRGNEIQYWKIMVHHQCEKKSAWAYCCSNLDALLKLWTVLARTEFHWLDQMIHITASVGENGRRSRRLNFSEWEPHDNRGRWVVYLVKSCIYIHNEAMLSYLMTCYLRSVFSPRCYTFAFEVFGVNSWRELCCRVGTKNCISCGPFHCVGFEKQPQSCFQLFDFVMRAVRH